MYPEAKINGGGTSSADWTAGLPDALKNKKPEGANGFTKVGDIYIFTKNGVAIDDKTGYKANGEATNIFDQAAKPDDASKAKGSDGAAGNKSGNKAGNGAGNGSLSTFGFGFTGTGTDLSNSWMNMGGGFEIDSNKMMKSAGLMGFISALGGMIPFGLGGLLSQGALQASMASFMNAVKFNFDFSNLNLSGDNTRTDDSEGASDSGDAGSVDTSKVPDGYKKTNVDGVFEKDGKYYKYDDNKKLVECKQDGTALSTSAAPADDSEGAGAGSAAGGSGSGSGSSSGSSSGSRVSGGSGSSSGAGSTGAGSGKKTSGMQGWYNAGKDKNNNIKGLTKEALSAAEAKKAGSAANLVVEKLVASKTNNQWTAEQKEKLRAEIIKKNPSVFNKDGSLKSNFDVSKLDIPTFDWMEKNIGKATKINNNNKTSGAAKQSQSTSLNRPAAATSGYITSLADLGTRMKGGIDKFAGKQFSKDNLVAYLDQNDQKTVTDIKNNGDTISFSTFDPAKKGTMGGGRGVSYTVKFNQSGQPVSIKSGVIQYDMTYGQNGVRATATKQNIGTYGNHNTDSWTYTSNGAIRYHKVTSGRNGSGEKLSGETYNEPYKSGQGQTKITLPSFSSGTQGYNNGKIVQGDVTWSKSGNNIVKTNKKTGVTETYDKNGYLIKKEDSKSGYTYTYRKNNYDIAYEKP